MHACTSVCCIPAWLYNCKSTCGAHTHTHTCWRSMRTARPPQWWVAGEKNAPEGSVQLEASLHTHTHTHTHTQQTDAGARAVTHSGTCRHACMQADAHRVLNANKKLQCYGCCPMVRDVLRQDYSYDLRHGPTTLQVGMMFRKTCQPTRWEFLLNLSLALQEIRAHLPKVFLDWSHTIIIIIIIITIPYAYMHTCIRA